MNLCITCMFLTRERVLVFSGALQCCPPSPQATLPLHQVKVGVVASGIQPPKEGPPRVPGQIVEAKRGDPLLLRRLLPHRLAFGGIVALLTEVLLKEKGGLFQQQGAPFGRLTPDVLIPTDGGKKHPSHHQQKSQERRPSSWSMYEAEDEMLDNGK